jgi:dipeptidyl-peptidase-3
VGPSSVTTYYDPRDFTAAEGRAIDDLLKAAKIRLDNTKVTRRSDRYDVCRVSIEVDDVGFQIGEVNGLPVFVTKGLHSEALKKVNKWLSLARDAALNATEADALTALIRHWETGDVAEHMRFSSLWLDDRSPTIEFSHGLIEDMRDPAGLRREYESVVGAVDARESRFLRDLLDNAPRILALLPYPRCYERQSFAAPSCSAINVLTFCTVVMPIGICMPLYDEIREAKGFKNISMSNVIGAMSLTPEKFQFVPDEQLPEVLALYNAALALNVATHEIYGHGSGTLLKQADVAGGKVPNLIDPERAVDTFWAEGETYQKVFGPLANPMEECRAEATALHLAFKDEVLELYGVPAERRTSFKVTATLEMMHMGIVGLSCYQPTIGQWLQPHAQARFGIIKAVIRWGKGALAVKQVAGRYKLLVDREKLAGLAEAVETLLKYLNYYKAARMPAEAEQFMAQISALDEFWLDVRKQAEQLKRGRSLLCGAVVRRTEDGYTLARCGGETVTVLDVVESIAESARLALE